MPVVFHVGTHKTATTSLQRYFSSNKALLKENNVIYPDYSDLIPGSTTSHYAHLDLAKSINGGKGAKFAEQEVFTMFNSINKLQSSHNVLISAEPFWRIGFGESENLFSHKISTLNRFFGAVQDPRIVATIRLRPDFMLSMYSENILQTTNKASFSSFLKRSSHLFDYQKNVDMWSSIGSLSLISFEYLKQSSNLGHSFLSLVFDQKFSSLAEKPTKFVNQSYAFPLILYKLHLNRQGYSREEGKLCIAKLNKILRSSEEDLLCCFKNYSWEDAEWWFANHSRYDHSELLKSYPTDSPPADFNLFDYTIEEAKKSQLKRINDTAFHDIVHLMDSLLDLGSKTFISNRIPVPSDDRLLDELKSPEDPISDQEKSSLQNSSSSLNDKDSSHNEIKILREEKIDLMQIIDNLNERVKDLQDEMKVTILQLELIQEELEYYFSLSRDSQRVLKESSDLQSKVILLLNDLNQLSSLHNST